MPSTPHVTSKTSPTQEINPTETTPAAGCFLRLVWLAFGNMALLLLAFHIATGPAEMSVRDLGFALAALAVVAARYLDVRYFAGATADGRPVTEPHLRRYILIFLAASGALWGLVRLLAST
jgi:hypothetical protein